MPHFPLLLESLQNPARWSSGASVAWPLHLLQAHPPSVQQLCPAVSSSYLFPSFQLTRPQGSLPDSSAQVHFLHYLPSGNVCLPLTVHVSVWNCTFIRVVIWFMSVLSRQTPGTGFAHLVPSLLSNTTGCRTCSKNRLLWGRGLFGTTGFKQKGI